MEISGSVSAPRRSTGPKRPFTYAEETNEAPVVVETEPVEVEESIPAQPRDSMQGGAPEDEDAPPLFEE